MSKDKNSRKLTAKQRFFKAMEMPISSVRLCVSDNIKAEIEGCSGIAVYEENEVKLFAGKLKIGFIGENLQITRYDDELTVIEGFINCVNYERG